MIMDIDGKGTKKALYESHRALFGLKIIIL